MVNKHILIGNLGKDPELRTTTNGNVATFSVATTESWKDANGVKQEQTSWHNIVVWGNLADVAAKWLKKGHRVYLEGKVITKGYQKDGATVYRTDTVLSGGAAVLRLLTPLDQVTQPAPQQQQPAPAPVPQALAVEADDDLPF